jgi:hypothetical protein
MAGARAREWRESNPVGSQQDGQKERRQGLRATRSPFRVLSETHFTGLSRSTVQDSVSYEYFSVTALYLGEWALH